MVKLGSKCFLKKPQSKKEDMSDLLESSSYLHVQHMVPGGENRARDGTPHRDGNNRIFLCVVLILSIVGNIVLGALLVVRFTNTHVEPEVSLISLNDVGSESVCVSCSSLGVPDDVEVSATIDRVLVRGAYLCCLRHSAHVKHLIHLLSMQQHEVEEDHVISTSVVSAHSQSSAHLYLDSTRLQESKLVWTDEYGWGSAFTGSDVVYVNGSLRVKEDGQYFVYSFITTKSRGTSESKNLLHKIYRENDRLPNLRSRILLINKQELPTNEESFLTSYLGACLVLRAGDEITVQVHPQSAVYAYAPANYFGLFRVF